MRRLLIRVLRHPAGRWAFVLLLLLTGLSLGWVTAWVLVSLGVPPIWLFTGIALWISWTYRHDTYCLVCAGFHKRPFCAIEGRSFIFPRQRS